MQGANRTSGKDEVIVSIKKEIQLDEADENGSMIGFVEIPSEIIDDDKGQYLVQFKPLEEA
jgi:hypothetical protein